MNSLILKKCTTKIGNEVVARTPIPSDAEEMIKYFNVVGGESENLMFGKDEFKLSVEQEQEYIKAINEESTSRMILITFENKIIGVGQIVSERRKRVAHNSSLSLSVKKEHWSDGVGSLIMDELIKFAKNNGVTKNINLSVNSKNYRGIGLYKKFDFSEIGTHKNNIQIDGKYYDEILMDLYI
ncbi:GNAT family N-acetyltransferase [Clostridium sp.]|uniref:GNAT family N-acetyltransferase n=1 Tax=Clostridium sp. TaxID=1506 RepID=UPI002FC81689